MRTAADLAAKLLAVLAQEERDMRSLSEEQASTRPGGGPGWVRKQELGHLLDSAVNNRVRFLFVATAGVFDGPGYRQDGWVELGGYAELAWQRLVDHWLLTNELLATAIARIPDHAMAGPCTVGQNPSVTLEFLIVDYILHLQHHLDHILDRPEITPYPGASPAV